MSESTATPLTDVSQLDEERKRYERWIAELGTRRSSTPDHVYRRVLVDYEERLQGVLGRLAEHGEALREAADELQQRVAGLASERQLREDERAEAELRHAVGEYDEEQWREIREVAEAEIKDLSRRLEDAEKELGRLEQVLALTAQAPPAPAPIPAAAPRTAAPAAAAPRAPAPPPAMPQRGATPPAAPQVAAAPASPSPLIEPRPDAAAALGGQDPDFATWPSEAEQRGAGSLRRDTPNNPLGLSDSGGAQIKTLRCQECGTMNYPTEWYCERCGGELAAL